MIRFYNHACFSVKHSSTVLLVDPYLTGTAFNNGWNLIATDIEYIGLDEVTHIWFSHEHPDHFSPSFLSSIEAHRRSEITILYQYTFDKRVKTFCEKFGFKFQELSDHIPYKIDDSFYITCDKIPFYDSWLLIQIDDLKILNTNDCILEAPERISHISRYVPDCDILFTQFSYANWMDNEDLSGGRLELSQEKLRRIKIQSEVFQPKFIVPFASFVYFCHEENYYMNDHINDPKTVVDFIQSECIGDPILLTPNQRWNGIDNINTKPSLDFWLKLYEDIPSKLKMTSNNSFNLGQLQEKSEHARNRIFKQNNKNIIIAMEIFKILPPAFLHVTDLNIITKFTWKRGLEVIEKQSSHKTVSMHSESLAFVFDNDFGIDTLSVNARFKALRDTKKKLVRTFAVMALNNTGRFLKILEFYKFFNLKFLWQGLRTTGLRR